MGTVRHLLFVCTGNTGRSATAAALARRSIAARGLALTVASRGLAVDPGNLEPEPLLLPLLAACGIDLAGHRAAPLAAADVGAADLILTMTAAHRDTVLVRFPDAAGKVRLVTEAAGGAPDDIADAFGAPPATYQFLVAQLDALVAAVLDRLAAVEPCQGGRPGAKRKAPPA